MKTLNYIFVLDRSGSMSSLRRQTLENVNGQIAQIKNDSKEQKIDIKMSILLFDSGDGRDWFHYVVRNKPVKEIKELTLDQYTPNGGTPLYDAIGHAVDGIQKDLAESLAEEGQKILVTIFTDGDENSSRKFNLSQTKKMIEHLQSDGKFLFTFIGCGGLKEVTGVSTSLGISASNTMAYCAGAEGNQKAFATLNKARTSYVRSFSAGKEKSVDFFEQEG